MATPCTVCGLPLEIGDYPCIATPRPHQSGINGAIGDECDFVQHNGTKHPIRFRSKSEHRLWLKQHGYRIAEDKSAKGSKSADIMDAYTMEAARVLVSRDNKASGWRDATLAPIGITSNDGIIRYLSDRNRAENRGEFGFSDR